MLGERDELSPLSPSKSAGCIIPSIVIDYNAHRYDVELYQRIEKLIEKKLPLYQTVEDNVMALVKKVSDAQRFAKMVC